MTTRRSLGYGYVNYATPQDVSRALNELNFIALMNGRAIRVMYSVRDPSLRKSGVGNIFIKNLDRAINHKGLHETFSAFGPILSCKVFIKCVNVYNKIFSNIYIFLRNPMRYHQ